MIINKQVITIKKVKIDNIKIGAIPGICYIYLNDAGVPKDTLYKDNIKTIDIAESYGSKYRYRCTIDKYPNDRIIKDTFCTLQYEVITQTKTI